MDKEIRLTVFTPVYNRIHTIHRPFKSLMKQTCKNFEWLVIDDGSTDGLEERIDEYAKSADFPVRYYYKKNGGKHTAMNMAYGLMKGEYFVVLDSDDALTENCVDTVLKLWDGIAEADRGGYWCVTGLCVDAENGKTIGGEYPEGINGSPDPKKLASLVPGDKTGCLKTAVARLYPFPEPEGTTFITESVVSNKIDKKYKQYYSNAILKTVFLNEPDSLCVSWYKNHIAEGYVSNYIWKLSVLNDVGITSKSDLKLFFTVSYYGLMAGKSSREILKSVENKKHRAFAALCILPAILAKATHGKRMLKQAR